MATNVIFVRSHTGLPQVAVAFAEGSSHGAVMVSTNVPALHRWCFHPDAGPEWVHNLLVLVVILHSALSAKPDLLKMGSIS